MVQETIAAGVEAPSAGREMLFRFEGIVPHAVLTDARLLVSELITNSVRHGQVSNGGIDVLIEVKGGRLQVHVRDQGPGFDPEGRYGPRYDSGWGLHLLAAISSEWGIDSAPGTGTDAWFVLRW